MKSGGCEGWSIRKEEEKGSRIRPGGSWSKGQKVGDRLELIRVLGSNDHILSSQGGGDLTVKDQKSVYKTKTFQNILKGHNKNPLTQTTTSRRQRGVNRGLEFKPSWYFVISIWKRKKILSGTNTRRFGEAKESS